MSEAPPPEVGNAGGQYDLSQMTNSPAVIAHLQQLAAVQQQLHDHQQQQPQQPAMDTQMGHNMNADVIQYNQNPVPAPGAAASGGNLSTADLLRHVQTQQMAQEQLVQEPVANIPAASAAQWSGNSLHDLVQGMNVAPALLKGGDLLQACAGAQQQVNISDFVANAQAYANQEAPQQPHFPPPDGAAGPDQAHGGVPAPPDSSAQDASLPAVPPPIEASPTMEAADVVYQVAPMDNLPAPSAPENPPPALVADSSIVVLAAKILTESDVKHSRAILPRIAVENNLPFLLGFRTYGLILPDPEGNQWEFTIKSWANGRADRALSERRKDRRVYVVEQMNSYLAKNKLVVGDVIGFVVVNGHVQVHCQTPELRGWIDRPTYGAPQLSNPPINVPAKCSVLEDIPEEESMKRKCQRSEKCSKPDGHPGFCVGRQEGQRARNSHARLKLTFWPPPSSDHLIPHTEENLVEVEPSQLPASGVFLSYVSTAPSNVNVIELPRGALLKLPVLVATQRSLQITVTGPPGQQHVLVARVLEDLVEGEDGLVPAAGRTLRWQLEGVAPFHAANFVEAGNQVCIERQGGGFAAQKLPVDAAPAAGPLNPTPTVAFGEFLCQRSQACFKAVNHTGFCSGHRGVKRNQDDDGTGTGKKRKTEPKRKGKSGRKAQADAMAAQLGLAPPPPHADAWVPQPHDPNMMTQQMYAVAHAAGMANVLPSEPNPDVPPVPVPAKHGEVSDAADMLLALSGTHQQDGTVDPNAMDVKAQIPAPQGSPQIPPELVPAQPVPPQAQIPPPAAASPVKQVGAVPMAVVGADGKASVEDSVMAMHGGQVPHMGEHEEDGSYLELLQSAVGSIHTSGAVPNYRDGPRPNM